MKAKSILSAPPSAPAPSGLLLQRKRECPQRTSCGRSSEKREETLQRSSINTYPLNGVPPIVHEVLESPGQPLDSATRSYMEPRFGHDFSHVRVHSDSRAASAAQAVNALAYTIGSDVVFGAGQYSPAEAEGRRLLGHELTHVVQQQGQSTDLSASPEVGTVDGPLEREAESAALTMDDAISKNTAPLTIGSAASNQILRSVRFRSKTPLAIDDWSAGTTAIVGDSAEVTHGKFAASATVHAEADKAGELDDWEVGFLQNDRITWSRTYWKRPNDDKRGEFLERKLKVPSTPLRDHLDDVSVWAADAESVDVAAAAGDALSVDIPIATGDEASTPEVIDGSSNQAGGEASDGTDNIFQFRQGDNFAGFISAHNNATDEWRHLELVYWSVQDSVDFASKPDGGVTITRDDRSLGKSRRFAWSRASDQPAFGAELANTYVNDPANTTIRRVHHWT
jgi:hypothetical protein